MMLDLPPQPRTPIGFVPLSQRPTPAQIVQNIWNLTPGAASTPAQIAAALVVSGSGLARIDVFMSAAAMATISSIPLVCITAAQMVTAGLANAILVPVLWSMSKNTNAIGALATVLSLQYADPSFNGFTSMTTIGGDTNNVRRGLTIGVSSVGLNVLNTATRNPAGLGLQIIGSADPGNFPASQTPARFSILFHSVPLIP